jgi:hypothetical protein
MEKAHARLLVILWVSYVGIAAAGPVMARLDPQRPPYSLAEHCAFLQLETVPQEWEKIDAEALPEILVPIFDGTQTAPTVNTYMSPSVWVPQNYQVFGLRGWKNARKWVANWALATDAKIWEFWGSLIAPNGPLPAIQPVRDFQIDLQSGGFEHGKIFAPGRQPAAPYVLLNSCRDQIRTPLFSAKFADLHATYDPSKPSTFTIFIAPAKRAQAPEDWTMIGVFSK